MFSVFHLEDVGQAMVENEIMRQYVPLEQYHWKMYCHVPVYVFSGPDLCIG